MSLFQPLVNFLSFQYFQKSALVKMLIDSSSTFLDSQRFQNKYQKFLKFLGSSSNCRQIGRIGVQISPISMRT